ncbi:MAG: hypothetical protein II630_03080 [Bacteroidales bacterium]|nr:hypothetical protein [Bacteroidales bacterium]
MTDEIIRIREELVGLSSDPIKTRELLDKLTEEEIFQNDIESPFHVGKNDIEETKDLEVGKLHKTKNGYLLHYHGGFSVLVDEKLMSTASTLQQIMEGVPSDITDKEEREGVEMVLSAAEQVFRLPMYVFSNTPTMLNIATMGLMYQNLLQKMGEVPTEETENPEYDKFLLQMNEMLDNFAAGLEKEGKEYERRNGINGKEEIKTESEGESQGEGENDKTESQGA